MQLLNDLKNHLNVKDIAFVLVSANTISFNLKVSDSSGKYINFSLEVSDIQNILHVKETQFKLPSFCPNRHINSDSSFCLGLNEELAKVDIETWFSYLKDYLRAQLRVDRIRKWPKTYKEWSHGDGAYYQSIVEKELSKLNIKKLGININNLKLIIRKSNIFPEKSYYHLYYNSVLLLTAFEDSVHNKRTSCICVRHGRRLHKTIGKCKNNCVKILFDIAFYEQKRLVAEENFWQHFKAQNKQCCNTMNRCGLR